MTRREGKIVFIAPEPPAPCELCGAVEELRPYGPNGARICFRCAMKDKEGTKRRFHKMMFGEDDT